MFLFVAFLDALASLDSKLSVSQSVIDVFRLAHLRVFQSYFDWSGLKMTKSQPLKEF